MKVLFLDIDGVLNFQQAFYSAPPCGMCGEHCAFDAKAVARLNRVLAETGARIVVSSSWRIGRNRSDLRELLAGHGVVGRVIDKTPSAFLLPGRDPSEGRAAWSRRGNEIKAWLDGPGEFAGVESFAIIDDDSDMEPLMHRLVKTNWLTGMLDEHADRLIEMLGTLK